MKINESLNNNAMIMDGAKLLSKFGSNGGSTIKFSSLLGDGNGNGNDNDNDKSIDGGVGFKSSEVEKAASELSAILPRMLISQMFQSIDNDSENGGFAQGMFRYLMVDEISKDWAENGTMKEVKESITKQLQRYEKATELGESYQGNGVYR